MSDNELKNVQEGKKVQLFRIAIQGAIKPIAGCISLETFTKIFGKVFNNRQSTIKKFHRCLEQFIFNQFMHEFEEFISDEHLDEKFKMVDRLIQESTTDPNTVLWRPPGNPREHMKTLDKQVKLKRKRELQEYVEAQEASMEHRRAIFKSQCLGLCEAKRNMKVEIKRLKLEGENIKNTLGDVGNMLEYPIMDPDKDKENTPSRELKHYFQNLSDSLIGSQK